MCKELHHTNQQKRDELNPLEPQQENSEDDGIRYVQNLIEILQILV
jgi:hypothetical protein